VDSTESMKHLTFKQRIRFWVIASIVVHVLVLTPFVVSKELRDWVFQSAEMQFFMGADEMAETQNRLRELYRERMLKTLNEMVAVEAQLRELAAEKRVELKERLSRRGRPLPPAGDQQLAVELSNPLTVDPQGDESYLEAMYRTAREHEADALAVFEKVRSIEMIDRQGVSLEHALVATKMAPPVHPEIDGKRINTNLKAMGSDFHAFKGELARMHAYTERMADQVNRWKLQAEGKIGEVSFMRVDATGQDMDYPGGNNIIEGAGPYLGSSLPPQDIRPSEDTQFHGKPLQGRKLMTSEGAGRPGDFMNLDTWYIVGPFEHPGEGVEEMDKTYPPEDEFLSNGTVNLDSVYVNRQTGEPLRWRFYQVRWDQWKMQPHVYRDYAVWYCYTEVYAEEDMTRWIMIGSDDYSRLWHDQTIIATRKKEPINSTGKERHAWIPDRDFKKVEFNKGVNRFLLKLENRTGLTGFNVIIVTPDLSTQGE